MSLKDKLSRFLEHADDPPIPLPTAFGQHQEDTQFFTEERIWWIIKGADIRGQTNNCHTPIVIRVDVPIIAQQHVPDNGSEFHR